MIPRRSLLNVLLLLPFLLFPLASTSALSNVTLRDQEADDSENGRLSPGHQGGGHGSIYPCNHAPTPLDEEICLMILKWRKDANKLLAERRFRTDIPPSSPAIVDPYKMTLSDAEGRYDCMDLACLCQLFAGNMTDGENCVHRGQTMKKAVRKEYRMLSKEERHRFHNALYRNKIGELQEYDKLAALHNREYAPTAHGGPAFVLWHREYLKRMEIALRSVEPTIGIPYWDSTLDEPLENPRDSVLWSSELLGDIDDEGNIISDIFANWTVLMPTEKVTLKRKLSGKKLINNEELGNFFIANKLIIYGFPGNDPNCHQPNKEEKANEEQVFVLLEQIHNRAHRFVGQHMADPDTAAFDPVFFLHHAFIDFIWEKWREQFEQNEREDPNQYPNDQMTKSCDAIGHSLNAEMRPFVKFTHRDGLSNKYTENLFEYAARPVCSDSADCGSEYLFCWRRGGISSCVSKIKPSGNCAKFETNAENPCYKGDCIEGKCQATEQPQKEEARDNKTGVEIRKVEVAICADGHECCDIWAFQGWCKLRPRYMNLWCRASCHYNKCVRNFYLDIGDRELADSRAFCSDYHLFCNDWKLLKPQECEINAVWMAENCREKCGHCDKKRSDVCRGLEPLH